MASLTQLVDAHANARDRLDERALYAVRSAIMGFEGWYSDGQVTDLAAQIVLQIEAAQKATAQLTNAYLSRVAESVVGKPVRPVPLVDPGELRTGVSHIEVYERLGMAYRFAASQGASREEALATTLARGEAMGQMDNLLAFRGQTDAFVAGSKDLSGYRRIIRPEMSRTGTCGLCAVASDQVYHSGELLPIHERCHCGVLPIVGGRDPGRSLNEEEFKTIYGAANGSTDGRDLKKVSLEIHQHGELGPVLRLKGQNFRGPSEVKSGPLTSSELDQIAEREAKVRAELKARKAAQLTPAERLKRDQEALARVRATLPPPKPRAAAKKPSSSVSEKQRAVFAKQKAARQQSSPSSAPRALPPTPKIKALPRKAGSASPATEMLNDVSKTNPNFGKAGYDINCVHVVATQEMRRRGYNVQATALPQAMRKERGRDVFEALRRWRNADGSPVRDSAFRAASDARGIESLVNTLPLGGRGWVFLQWKDGGGHIMNVERTATGVRWLEAQQGKAINPSAYLRRGVSFNFARVDNLVPTDAVMEFMEPGRS